MKKICFVAAIALCCISSVFSMRYDQINKKLNKKIAAARRKLQSRNASVNLFETEVRGILNWLNESIDKSSLTVNQQNRLYSNWKKRGLEPLTQIMLNK